MGGTSTKIDWQQCWAHGKTLLQRAKATEDDDLDSSQSRFGSFRLSFCNHFSENLPLQELANLLIWTEIYDMDWWYVGSYINPTEVLEYFFMELLWENILEGCLSLRKSTEIRCIPPRTVKEDFGEGSRRHSCQNRAEHPQGNLNGLWNKSTIKITKEVFLSPSRDIEDIRMQSTRKLLRQQHKISSVFQRSKTLSWRHLKAVSWDIHKDSGIPQMNLKKVFKEILQLSRNEILRVFLMDTSGIFVRQTWAYPSWMQKFCPLVTSWFLHSADSGTHSWFVKDCLQIW